MRVRRWLMAIVVVFHAATTAWAQTAVTASDLAVLDSTVKEIERFTVNLKKTDPTAAAQVERSLADLRDEITYFRVRLRREEGIPRADYNAVRDRLETLLIRARGDKVTAQPILEDEVTRVWRVAVGTPFDVRLQTPLDSGTAKVEQRFEATTIVDFSLEGSVVIPAGSVMRGFVSSVRPAGKIERKGTMTLSFDELRIGDRSFRMRASVIEALDGKVSEDATRIGAGAIAGGIVGAVLGGARGAMIGVIVGGGGAIAATEGANVDLPVGAILRVRLDQPLQIAK